MCQIRTNLIIEMFGTTATNSMSPTTTTTTNTNNKINWRGYFSGIGIQGF